MSDIVFAQAIASVQNIVNDLNKKLEAGELLTDEEAGILQDLSTGIEKLRNGMIARALRKGLPGKKIAAIYGLSEARISQIKRDIENEALVYKATLTFACGHKIERSFLNEEMHAKEQKAFIDNNIECEACCNQQYIKLERKFVFDPNAVIKNQRR